MTYLAPGQEVRYRCYDLVTYDYITDLPLSGVTFGLRLNVAGTFNGTLNLTDPRITNLDPLEATQPSRTLLIVDFNGSPVWGGIIWTRQFSRSAPVLTLGAQEAWSYFSHRVQAKDYTNTWATVPQDSLIIADTIVTDAIAVTGSAFQGMTINRGYLVPNTSDNWITASFPLTQLQTIDTLITNLAGMGYGVGFDFGIDWTYVSGAPRPVLHLSYPRRGQPYDPATSKLLDTQPAYDYTYPEDGTTQANKVYLTASIGSGTSDTAVDSPASIAAGYPLLEEVANYPQVNTGDQLSALAAGELATHVNVPTTPKVDIDPFGDFGLENFINGQFTLGDDIRWLIPNQIVIPPVADERFPGGTAGEF